jgi:hypothetical protein
MIVMMVMVVVVMVRRGGVDSTADHRRHMKPG